MESIDISSIINLEKKLSLEEKLISHEAGFIFPKKKLMTNEEINLITREKIKVVLNYADFNFILDNLGIYIYAISVIEYADMKLKMNELNYLLNTMKKIGSFVAEMEKVFKSYVISGNQLFGIPFDSQTDFLFYKLFFKPGECNLLSNTEFEDRKINEENKKFLFEIKIEKKIKIGMNMSKEIGEGIKRYINILIGYKLKKLDYIKSIESRKTIYFKDFKKHPQTRIQIDQDKFYSSGYQITSNLYENQCLFLKIIPKFRLCRQSTYSDYLNYLHSVMNETKARKTFENDVSGARGLKLYDQQPIKIDGVGYANPSEIHFERKRGDLTSTSNLVDYYLERWGIKIDKGVQPILYRNQKERNVQTGEVTETKHYFFPHLIFVVGLLPKETVNARILKYSPDKKFDTIVEVLNDISKVTKNDNDSSTQERLFNLGINYEPVKMTANVLHQPVLEFKSAKISPNPETGAFDHVQEPFKNEDLNKWMLILYDCSEREAEAIFIKIKTAALNLKINIAEPDIHIVGEFQDIRDYFDNLLINLSKEERNKQEKDRYQIIVLFTSSRKKSEYKYFKDSFNYAKFEIASQVVIKEKALKTNYTYHTSLLIQMWAKRDLSSWRIKFPNNFKDTVIISYAVTHNKTTGKNLTTVGITLNRFYNSMYFLSEYDEGQTGTGYSTNLEILIFNALNEAIIFKKEKFINNIIVYREGLNESQRKTVMEFEFEALKRGIEEVSCKYNLVSIPKICLIFVNKICDTKIFQCIQSESSRMSGGYERYSQPRYSESILNVPVGTLIDSKIVLPNCWEFYLNSTYATEGTNNPTHYIVGYDSTDFPAFLLYGLTYSLTYYYYNTSKPVRFPATLHRVLRRNKFIIDNINGKMNVNSRYIDISL